MIRRIGWTAFLIGFVVLGSFCFFKYYSYIFSKNVRGVVKGVKKVTDPTTLIGAGGIIPSDQIFSFAIAVESEESHEIFTGSTEDRQWAVVQEGQCAEARFYPYPFWELDKGGTYFNVRLIKQYNCK